VNIGMLPCELRLNHKPEGLNIAGGAVAGAGLAGGTAGEGTFV